MAERKSVRGRIAAPLMILTVAACATSGERAGSQGPSEAETATLDMMLGGGRAADEETVAAVEASGPLGSRANPVRAHMSQGQRAYMRSLRCPDGSVPRFQRDGSAGGSPYGGITDVYSWSCPGGEEGSVYIDMYHPGHVERRAPEGQALRSVNEA